MPETDIIPHLFRSEYRKIIAVLSRKFGFDQIEKVEDIASETFLLAAETWGLKGLPKNPTAWLYTVAKNKAVDSIRHSKIYNNKIFNEIRAEISEKNEIEIDLTTKNITDSQLQMMFAICHPSIPVEAQIGLSLSILCGFGTEEIAEAFLTTKEAIYKRLARAKERLRIEKVTLEFPSPSQINERLDAVLTTLYLFFSEGYYSNANNVTLRKDFCIEAMRLNLMLLENEQTDTPAANALLSLMCFHSSRFEARIDQKGDLILYEDQDESLWNVELITKGEYFLNNSSTGRNLSKYHLEAAIAYWHTKKTDSVEKWENILQLYNKLLQIEYSPIAALNRTYALAKANGTEKAIVEAEKLNLLDNHLYHNLLGKLFEEIDYKKSLEHLNLALKLSKKDTEKALILSNINRIESLL